MFVQWSRSRSRCPSVEEWALHHARGQRGSNCTLVLPLLLIRTVTDEALFRQIFCCSDFAFCPDSLAKQKKRERKKGHRKEKKKEKMSTSSSSCFQVVCSMATGGRLTGHLVFAFVLQSRRRQPRPGHIEIETKTLYIKEQQQQQK